LLQVYATAQGPTRLANTSAVEITRAPKVNTAGVSTPSEIITVDLRSILARQKADIQLEPGDVITVPLMTIMVKRERPLGLIAGISN
jgi:hypothetical protein